MEKHSIANFTRFTLIYDTLGRNFLLTCSKMFPLNQITLKKLFINSPRRHILTYFIFVILYGVLLTFCFITCVEYLNVLHFLYIAFLAMYFTALYFYKIAFVSDLFT